MEYGSAIKKKNILQFAATWMDLEGIMLSEISQRKTNTVLYHSIQVESKKYNKLVNITKKKQTHRYGEQTSSYQWGKGKRGGNIWVVEWEVQTAMYKINKQQGYIVQHGEIQPLFCNNFKWSIIYTNIASPCATPETNIIL